MAINCHEKASNDCGVDLIVIARPFVKTFVELMSNVKLLSMRKSIRTSERSLTRGRCSNEWNSFPGFASLFFGDALALLPTE